MGNCTSDHTIDEERRRHQLTPSERPLPRKRYDFDSERTYQDIVRDNEAEERIKYDLTPLRRVQPLTPADKRPSSIVAAECHREERYDFLSRRIHQKTEHIKLVLIGNPGVGKSTLLNAILGRVVFQAGLSLGNGLTEILQEVLDQYGNSLIDTPGLSDVSARQKAAQEIKKALTKGGHFKIIFVITLEAGRIKPDDMTTMKLVLQAAPMIDRSYSIVINKVSDDVASLWTENRARNKFMALINQDLPGTSSVFLNQFDKNLDCKTDTLSILSREFKSFLEEAPSLTIDKENVKDIQISEFEEIKKNMSKKIQEFENRNKVLLQQMEQKEKFLQSKIAAFEAEKDLLTKKVENTIEEKDKLLQSKIAAFEAEKDLLTKKIENTIEEKDKLLQLKITAIESEKNLLNKKLEGQNQRMQKIIIQQDDALNQKGKEVENLNKKLNEITSLQCFTMTTIPAAEYKYIQIIGGYGYQINPPKVTLSIDKIKNLRDPNLYSNSTSEILYLRLFATKSSHRHGDSIQGYVVAQCQLNAIGGNEFYCNILETLDFYWPPKGEYNLVLTLCEFGNGVVDFRNLTDKLNV